jgi:hypothetical protein
VIYAAVVTGWAWMVSWQAVLLTVADLADDVVVEIADERGAGRPRPLVANGALVGSVPGY